jgi:hypothetical protein
MSSAWTMWFQKVYLRLGASVSDSLTDVSSTAATASTQATQTQAGVDALNEEVSALQIQQTAQGTDLAAQGVEISAIQETLAPGITVLITTAKLTTLGVNGSMTFINGILTAQVQST